MSERILVPHDHSEQASYALDYAVGTFESAEMVLLHVLEPLGGYPDPGGYEASRYTEQLDNAEEMLESVREEYGADGERIETAIAVGRPTREIPAYVDNHVIDHIVIGSHGRDGAARLLLGSVAEAVARRSPVPVTVVRDPPESDEPPETVLVPFDGSTHARRALSFALDQFEGAEVTALYVAYPDGGSGRTSSPADAVEGWDAERTAHVESVLDGAETLASERGRTVRTASTEGSPADAIVAYVETEDIDHVVIGSTGRDGIARLLLGSVAETVVRRSPVTVTIGK